MRHAISIENRVAISISKLGTRNTLCGILKVYGMVESIISKNYKKFL
jgi:hypothetical protein